MEPDHALALHRRHRPGEPVLASEVFQVEADRGVELLRQRRGGPAHGEVAQGVGEPVGVAVEPVELAAIGGGQDAVLPRHLRVEQRMGDRRLAAEQDGIAVDALAGDAVEALGDVEALDLDPRARAGLGLQGDAADAEAVGRELVAVRRDAEEDFLVHQPRLVERHQAVGVGVIAHAGGRPEFHHRHAAAGLPVDDLDGEVPVGLVPGGRWAAPTRQQHEDARAKDHHAGHGTETLLGL